MTPRAIPEDSPARNWTPQWNGEKYCSPACGGGCTRAAYEAAKKRAERLAAKLGDGWKPVVWENLGWYAKVVFGQPVAGSTRESLIAVYINTYLAGPTTYWCDLHCPQQFHATHADPVKGVRTVVRQAREYAAVMLAGLDALQPLEKGLPQ